MLHIINRSPFQSSSLTSCLRLSTANDALLFIEDGVYAATTALQLPTHLLCYALQTDVIARGIEHKLAKHIQLIDYPDFVDLTVSYSHIQTWL